MRIAALVVCALLGGSMSHPLVATAYPVQSPTLQQYEKDLAASSSAHDRDRRRHPSRGGEPNAADGKLRKARG
jgi:hypothetical protein